LAPSGTEIWPPCRIGKLLVAADQSVDESGRHVTAPSTYEKRANRTAPTEEELDSCAGAGFALFWAVATLIIALPKTSATASRAIWVFV
jgi:hypothetical protein